MTIEAHFEQHNQVVKKPFSQENGKQKIVPPRPIGQPQVVPPQRKPEVEKRHIKRDGKN